MTQGFSSQKSKKTRVTITNNRVRAKNLFYVDGYLTVGTYEVEARTGNASTNGAIRLKHPTDTQRFVSMYYDPGPSRGPGQFTIDNQGGGTGVYLDPVSGTGWHNYSDVALKAHVVAHEPVLARVTQLRPVRFTWKSTGANGSGFIAQEVEALFPDLVREGSVDETSGRRLKSMPYERFAVLAIAAIKELKTEYDTRFEALERKLATQGKES